MAAIESTSGEAGKNYPKFQGPENPITGLRRTARLLSGTEKGTTTMSVADTFNILTFAVVTAIAAIALSKRRNSRK